MHCMMRSGFPFIYTNIITIITLCYPWYMGCSKGKEETMANYQGLDCIMGEITTMVSAARYPHDQHIYDYFTATEKFMRIAVPQLFLDCMEGFREQLII